jgi:uncharacterized protein YebE (UPF0316 family)
MNLEFFSSTGPAVYAFIFFGKIVEVAASTLRIVIINRGEKLKGAFIAAFEVLLWIIIAGTVLNGFQDDPLKIAVYVLAFAIGVYLGTWLEAKIALGFCSMHIIIPDNDDENRKNELMVSLRQHGYGLTSLDGNGKDGHREVLLLHLKRKKVEDVIKLAQSHFENAVIAVNDIKTIKGGFITQ